MLVRAVASVNHTSFESLREKLRRACEAVTQHKNIGVQRLEIARGVFKRFALGQAGRTRRDVNHIGAQAKRGQLKRCSGTRARLDKEVYQRFAAQRRDLLDLACADLFECVGGIENEIDFLGRKFAEAEQIFAVPAQGKRRIRRGRCCD